MVFLSPKEVKTIHSLSLKGKAFIAKSRLTIQDILSGKDQRIAIILGPCSIHDIESAILYASKLKKLSDTVKETCFLVMRVYLEKPRTVAGWKGFLYDPYLDESNAIEEGISLSRKLLIALANLEIPVATEFLSPLAAFYLDDLISWGFIGARTTSSQIHRELASYLPLPIGFKNNTDGNVEQAAHGVIAARMPHTFLHTNVEGKISVAESEGNPHTHIVLRGGEKHINYDHDSISQTLKTLRSLAISSRILVDCAHGNCKKNHNKQRDAFLSALGQIHEGNTHLMGMMVESYLSAGHQLLPEDPSSLVPGVSITDPCIDWSETEELVLLADELISSKAIKFTHS
ncbi:MAG: 3-deoxy-7-phosphoheptulonate synthase [Rhabdochlamydiaceae bacterium]|jgi:3-deoxy-7-phosphoheptulonate synthase